MNIDVGKAISELLFEHETVIVPGFGGFTSVPESATVDYVQGVVTPPAKKIGFNPNLVLNDGVLVGHIQAKSVVTAQQAKEAVDTYVAGLKAALERREIIEVPSVGRIYRDYEQKLKFMPEGTNFEAKSFGLPGVKFTPVERVKAPSAGKTTGKAAAPKIGKVAAATQVAAAASQKAKAKTGAVAAASSGWLNKFLPALIVVSALLLAFSLFMIFRGESKKTVAGLKGERVNVPPPSSTEETPGEDAQIPAEDNATVDVNEGPGTANPGGPDAPSNDISQTGEAATSPSISGSGSGSNPGTAVAGSFIVVHSFGVSANARKFERQLKKDGYDARSTKQGGLNRVGVQVSGMSPSEIDRLISTLGKKYKSTPKLVDY